MRVNILVLSVLFSFCIYCEDIVKERRFSFNLDVAVEGSSIRDKAFSPILYEGTLFCAKLDSAYRNDLFMVPFLISYKSGDHSNDKGSGLNPTIELMDISSLTGILFSVLPKSDKIRLYTGVSFDATFLYNKWNHKNLDLSESGRLRVGAGIGINMVYKQSEKLSYVFSTNLPVVNYVIHPNWKNKFSKSKQLISYGEFLMLDKSLNIYSSLGIKYKLTPLFQVISGVDFNYVKYYKPNGFNGANFSCHVGLGINL